MDLNRYWKNQLNIILFLTFWKPVEGNLSLNDLEKTGEQNVCIEFFWKKLIEQILVLNDFLNTVEQKLGLNDILKTHWKEFSLKLFWKTHWTESGFERILNYFWKKPTLIYFWFWTIFENPIEWNLGLNEYSKTSWIESSYFLHFGNPIEWNLCLNDLEKTVKIMCTLNKF